MFKFVKRYLEKRANEKRKLSLEKRKEYIRTHFDVRKMQDDEIDENTNILNIEFRDGTHHSIIYDSNSYTIFTELTIGSSNYDNLPIA